MARDSALPDGDHHTSENEICPNIAISEYFTSAEIPSKYETLVELEGRELPDADTNLLKNPVHPIFRRQNWKDSAQDAWPQLQPALHLASRFIGEDEMLAFWYQLVWGRQKIQDAFQDFGYALDRFSADGPPLTTAQKQQISRWLWEFGEQQQSSFLSFKAGIGLGRTTRIAAKNIVLELGLGLLELLRDRGSGKKALSETQRLRVNFLIAIVLLHELGHAVYMFHSRSRYEPYYGNHAVAELGHAWGCWAFGGTITTIKMPPKVKTACVGGLWVATPPSPWQGGSQSEARPTNRPPPPVLGDVPKSITGWVLSIEYIQRVQTEGFWESDVREHGVRALHVPPTDGSHDSRLPWNNNWSARLDIRRDSDDGISIDGCSYRSGVESKKRNWG